jgi:nucleotide-binding universal stress UspA family protein
MIVPPKLILVPLDFSDPSNAALDVAADLAAKFGSELCLVHVVPMLPKLPATVSIFKEGDYEQELHRNAEQRLMRLVQVLAKKSIAARYVTGTANDVPMELIRTAEHEKADLIVIASHGVTGWNRFVLGSVAEKVVHLAPCPVLILRAHHDAAQEAPSDNSKSVSAVD